MLLIRLVIILVEATSALASSTASSSATSSIVEFVVSTVSTSILGLIVIITVHHIVLLLHFVLDIVDKFLYLIDILLFIFVMQVVLRFPELDLKWLKSISKHIGLVKHLDALLSLFDSFKADESIFV